MALPNFRERLTAAESYLRSASHLIGEAHCLAVSSPLFARKLANYADALLVEVRDLLVEEGP